MDKLAIINRIKKSYQSVRVANIRPTGILDTRALVLTMLMPIILVVVQYLLGVIQGYVSDETNKLINIGLNIIDHIFNNPVLIAVVGFLSMWIDKDGNGIPDKLEEQPKIQPLSNITDRSDKK